MKQLRGRLYHFFESTLNWIYGRFNGLRNLWQKRPSLAIKSIAITIQELASAFLKLGTLFLVGIIVYWLWCAVGTEGYVIEPFNVPKHLEESGFDGTVLARKIQDEMLLLKEEAGSIKEDSLILSGNDSPDLNLSVLSVGFSLNSISHHLKNLLGRKNYFIRGDVTYLDSIYGMTLRMTGFEPILHEVSIENKSHGDAINELFRKGGESILMNTDPYRLAVICYKQDRFEEGLKAVNKILKDRPNEAHWAYLAWGSIVEKKKDYEAAPSKFLKAVEIKPDYALGWYRLGSAYRELEEYENASNAYSKALKLAPDNIGWHTNIAWFHHNEENHEKSDSIFKSLTERHPKVYYVWTSWANSKLNREEIDEAIALLEESQKYVGHDANGLMTLAYSSFMKKDTMKAFEYMDEAFDLNNSNANIVSNYMQGLYFAKEFELILEIGKKANWDEMTNNHYKKYEAKTYIATAHNRLGNSDEALKIIRKAISEADYSMLYIRLAETHAYQGQIDSFYYNLEHAFDMGYKPKWLREFSIHKSKEITYQEPFNRFINEQRFINLINKYKSEKSLKG